MDRDLEAGVVEQVADGARSDIHVALRDLDEVVQPDFAPVHHREDLHRDRHLVGARHGEELFAVQRDPAPRFEVVGRDADASLRLFGQTGDFGGQKLQAGIFALNLNVLRGGVRNRQPATEENKSRSPEKRTDAAGGNTKHGGLRNLTRNRDPEGYCNRRKPPTPPEWSAPAAGRAGQEIE